MSHFVCVRKIYTLHCQYSSNDFLEWKIALINEKNIHMYLHVLNSEKSKKYSNMHFYTMIMIKNVQMVHHTFQNKASRPKTEAICNSYFYF